MVSAAENSRLRYLTPDLKTFPNALIDFRLNGPGFTPQCSIPEYTLEHDGINTKLTWLACRVSKNIVKTLIKSTARDMIAAAVIRSVPVSLLTFVLDARNLRTSRLVRHSTRT